MGVPFLFVIAFLYRLKIVLPCFKPVKAGASRLFCALQTMLLFAAVRNETEHYKENRMNYQELRDEIEPL